MVTGATGFIGSALVKALTASGEEVQVLSRPQSISRVPAEDGVRIFEGDLDSSSSLDLAMRGCTGVYHLAACTGVWYRDVGRHNHINVEGTRRVLYAAKRAGVESVVVCSTAGVTGPSLNQVPLQEDAPSQEDGFTQYEGSKILMEKMIQQFPSEGMRIVVVRPTRLYGPGPLSKSNTVTRMLVNYLKGRWHVLPGTGNHYGNYTYVHDVVKGHILAMRHGRHKECYHLGGEDMTYRQLFQRAGAVYGKQHTLYPLPYPLMLGASALLKGVAFLSNTEPAISPGWVKRYHHHWMVSSQKAVEELGYQSTPFEVGVEKIIEHYAL